MEGRTISKVELGSGKISTVCTKSEALVIHFSDGSIMGIDTGSNART
jgi:hypothetical protein